MHRFYKITTFDNGRQWIDIGAPLDLTAVHEELQTPLAVGQHGVNHIGIPRTVTEFLIYES